MRNVEQIYKDLKLPASDSIRILHILPSSSDDDIALRLQVISLRSDPKYEALSYTWGGSPSGRSVRVNTTYQCLVTDNLFHALRRLKKPSEIRTLWVDAICINQQDTAERSKQVAKMADIYEQAPCVNVWLGDVPDGHVKPTFRGFLNPLNVLDGIFSMRLLRSLHQNHAKSMDVALSAAPVQWHDRAWVIQEFALANKVFLHSGSQSILYSFDVIHSLSNGDLHDRHPVFNKFALRLFNVGRLRGQDYGKATKKSTPGELNILQAARTLQGASAKDPKDMIYCILGLISKPEASLITVDYNLTVQEIYAQATYASIKCSSDFSILEGVPLHNGHHEGWPSWICDYRESVEQMRYDFRGRGDAHSLGFVKQPNCPYQGLALDDPNMVLTLPGAHCDMIVDTFALRGYMYETLNRNATVEVAFFVEVAVAYAQLALSQLMDPLGSKAEGIYLLRTLLSLNVQREKASLYTAGSALFDLPTPSVLPNERKMPTFALRTWNRLMSRHRPRGAEAPMMASKKHFTLFHIHYLTRCPSECGLIMFSTRCGLIGFASCATLPDDVIILIDHHCPFMVLGRTTGGRHLFKGFAYVHGMMNKCFWSRWEEGDVQWQQFLLC